MVRISGMVRPLAIILAGCGTSDNEPTIPYTAEAVGQMIHFTAPIGTATTDQQPNNVEDRTTLTAGDHTFSWTPVDGADSYVLILNDASEVGLDVPDAAFSAYARLWTNEPSTTVHLESTSDSGRPLVILAQVLGHDGDNIIGSSAFWTLKTVLWTIHLLR